MATYSLQIPRALIGCRSFEIYPSFVFIRERIKVAMIIRHSHPYDNNSTHTNFFMHIIYR